MNPPPDPSRPWISANLAVSADGKVSDAAGRCSGWTSRDDHQRLLELRAGADALMVGRRTLVADRMTLTRPGEGPQPLRCVVARDTRIPMDHPLFTRPGGAVHWLSTTDAGPPACGLPAGTTLHHGPLAGFLTEMRDSHGVRHLHCEGGGTLIRMLAEMDAIDELHLTLAGHTIFGGFSSATLTGTPGDWLTESLKLRISSFTAPAGTGECYLSYRRADRPHP